MGCVPNSPNSRGGDLPCGPEEIYGFADIAVLLRSNSGYFGYHRTFESVFIKPNRDPLLQYLVYLYCIVRGERYPAYRPWCQATVTRYWHSFPHVAGDVGANYNP